MASLISVYEPKVQPKRYDAFGGDILNDYLRIFKIECLLEMMDVWLDQLQAIPIITKNLRIPLVTHVTVNSSPLSPFLSRFLAQSDYIVCPSRFVYNEVTSVFARDIYQIEHGVDTNIFKPLPDGIKQETKRKLKIEDKEFVILTVMRNKSPLQKNFPALFHAWKMLLEEEPILKSKGVLLCLSDPFEVGSTNLVLLRDRAGLRDFVKFVWAKPTGDGSSLELTYEGDSNGICHNANINFSAQEMSKLYNVGDLFALSSFGESFNLPCLESMACGLPQISAAHTTGPELVGEPKTGLLVDVCATIDNPLITSQWIINPLSLGNCMRTLYTDEKLRKECSTNALNFAKTLSWDKIIPKWISLFDKVDSDMMKVDYNKMRLGI